MAFTKAPTTDNHNVVRIGVAGSPILTASTASLQPTTASYINCFPWTEKQWNGQPVTAIHKREPWGLNTVATGSVTTAGVRGSMVQAYNNYKCFFAKGTTVYSWDQSTNTVASVQANTDYGRGSSTNFIDSTNARRIAFLETYTAGTTYLMACLEDGTSVTTTNLIAITADGSKGLVFIDGYLFAVDQSGTRIFNSNANGVYTTWTSTDFLDAEQYADLVTYIAKHKNYLVAFGQSSIEFFYDAGIEIGSPLTRQESYATRIGIIKPATTITAANCIAQFEDDIYFMGISETGSIALYRIKDFHVEEVGNNQWVQGVLNNSSSDITSIASYQINNNPTVVIEFSSGDPIAYNITADDWWQITGTDFIAYTDRIGQPFTRLLYVNNATNDTTSVFSNPTTATSSFYSGKADATFGTSIACVWYTPVQDLGINYYKHLARIDAIGDYRTNTCTLSINPTPKYTESYTSCGSQNQSTIGYGNNMSWYNLGAPRRFILKWEMSGQDPAIHRGFDVEYNIGVA